MTDRTLHDFGQVPEHGDCFEFVIGAAGQSCVLIAVVQTERGPRRSNVASIDGVVWRKIALRVVRELAHDMGEEELTGKKLPTLKSGGNRLSPLVGRELALLLWALQEKGSDVQLEAILHGWRELAREERWWLYAKAAAPGQQTGSGWRRALFHALSEVVETRAAAPQAEKKTSEPTKPRRSLRTQARRLMPVPDSPVPQPVPAARKRKTAAATSPS